MSRRTTGATKAGLGLLHASGADRLLAPWTQGEGAILMLHQVNRARPAAFQPNRILRIDPDFLEQVIRHVIAAGYETLALDEVPDRLAKPQGRRPFVAFTLDDGYRDNLTDAYPVFKRYGIPFTVYVPADYADGAGDLWWLALEAALARIDLVDIEFEGVSRRHGCATPASKEQLFHRLYWQLRGQDETVARAFVRRLSATAGVASSRLCGELIMSWDEIRRLAADPLVTIGAHTRRHFALAKLTAAAAQAEMADSIARIERELGRPVRHFSYPYGDRGSCGPREFALAAGLGLATAVTTEKGMLHAGDAARPMALPRLSLNGDYQDLRYVKALLSGLPFALHDTARRGMRRRALV